jgi:hypothetical protein
VARRVVVAQWKVAARRVVAAAVRRPVAVGRWFKVCKNVSN